MRGTMPPSLLSYLTLFRSEKRALSFERALKLAKEALQLSADPAQLEAAMAETVEAMRTKREQGQGTALKNHNYLKKVLGSTPTASASTSALVTSDDSGARPAARSKTASAIGRLENWKRG
ncbi:hypothetical protein [Geomonas limicola]|nr:hypothetical protein [Geomonas limicola]